MGQMETLLVTQRQKSSQLESQLSAAQDRIGGAERRAKLLESENTRIQGEIQYWNDLYSQETGTTPPPPVSSASVLISPPAEGSMISSPPADSNVTAAIPNVPLGSVMPQDQMVSSPLLSFPSLMTGFGSNEEVASPLQSMGAPFGANDGIPPGSSFVFGSDVPQANRGFGSSFAIPQEPNERRVSFGSTFSGSSGNGGNGNGTSGIVGVPRTQVHPGSAATFNIGIKPKDPPVFHGRANEDVDTWLAKVGDFLYLTEANPRQQVAYAATLLQEAAADWWVALLRERSGRRPEDFAEFTVLLCKRFGSSTRVDRARAELRNIRQGQSETVRSYSTRFESLLGKLPTHDREWARVQFIWGLHQRIAELVTIASPSDLHAAINQAEKIEMARNFAATGQQGQKQGNLNRGRGSFYRGRGKFSAVQSHKEELKCMCKMNLPSWLYSSPVMQVHVLLDETNVENVVDGDIGQRIAPPRTICVEGVAA